MNPTGSGRAYGKLFPDLPALGVDVTQLAWMGSPGGPCDLGIDDNPDSEDSRVDAVWPFFGQFVAHDLTADRSPLDHVGSGNEISNFRLPRADLECLYGSGPIDAPFMFERDDPARFLLAPSGVDVPRNQEGVALIADARNDSHLFISQMHVAFAKLHNRLVDGHRQAGVETSTLFEHARRSTISHYRHIILCEFLATVIGSSLAEELIEDGPRYFAVGPDGPRVPVEFAAAAYRYGHAQIRRRYQINSQIGPVAIFPDLVGFRPVGPEHAVDWTLHIGRNAQKAKRIDTRLPRALLELPPVISGVPVENVYSSLAARDLARGPLAGLPSGEAIAREMGITPLEIREIGLAPLGWRHETPLWLYVLREAEVLCSGEHLGPVGGRIVGEVLVGIINHDRDSHCARDYGRPFPAEDGLLLEDVLLR